MSYKSKYQALLLSSFLAFSLGGCARGRDTERYIHNNDSTNVTRVEKDRDDNCYREEVNNTREENRIEYKEEKEEQVQEEVKNPDYREDYSDLECFVNEDVYNNLVEAKKNFDCMYSGGAVSSYLENNGYTFNVDQKHLIDSTFENTYEVICKYIEAYQNNDIECCYRMGVTLFDSYHNGVTSKDYLVDLLVLSKLPNEYHSTLGVNQYGYYGDFAGNILLDNGKQIRCVGVEDELLFIDSNSDMYTVMNERSRYYKNLPTIINSHYSMVEDDSSKGICYVWNDNKVNDIIQNEWDSLKKEAGDEYSVDWIDIQILPGEPYNFTDKNANVLGPLNYDQQQIVKKVYYIIDARDNSVGDALVIDAYLKDLVSPSKAFIKR